jgi:DNA-binding HxlR family transcriptional regulator
MTRKSVAKVMISARRSPCPVACALDLFGDRWTLLVVRDLVLGSERFKEFAASAERIPTNILSDRLSRLVTHHVAELVPAADGTRHPAYRLTEKGRALIPILATVRDWGLTWEQGTQVKGTPKLFPPTLG